MFNSLGLFLIGQVADVGIGGGGGGGVIIIVINVDNAGPRFYRIIAFIVRKSHFEVVLL